MARRAISVGMLAALFVLGPACGGGAVTPLPGLAASPPEPALVSVAPASGTTAGGTTLTVTGTGFRDHDPGENTVTVAGVPAWDVTVIDDETLTCTTPPRAPGVVDVALANANGWASLPGGFSYVSPQFADKTAARVWEPVTFTWTDGTLWDFGDGHVSRGAVVTHAFTLPGTYDVTIDGGAEMNTVTIHPETLPNPAFRAQLPFSNLSAGMWAHNDLAFVPGISDGIVHVVDVSDPAAPVETSTITDAGGARGMRAWGHWIATAKEGGGNACDIYDVQDPAAPVKIAVLAPGASAHNVGIWDNFLVLNGIEGTLQLSRSATSPEEDPDGGDGSAPSLLFYDVSNPAAPVLAGSWDGGVFVHDSQRLGDRVYAACGQDGLYVLDVSDPMLPVVLGQVDQPGYSHNVWPSGDGETAFTTEETAGEPMKIWDVSDPADITFVADWQPASGAAIIHNVVVAGTYAYIAYYTYGLSVLDVSDPLNPVEVFHHDTFPSSDATVFDGAWMVYPFGDRIFISDISGGLFTYVKDAPAP